MYFYYAIVFIHSMLSLAELLSTWLQNYAVPGVFEWQLSVHTISVINT